MGMRLRSQDDVWLMFRMNLEFYASALFGLGHTDPR